MKQLIISILIIKVTTCSVFSQFFYDKYVNVKLGQGIAFSGLGTAIEYRCRNWGILGSLGYKQEQFLYEHVVPSSWNLGADIRYYFSKNNANWQFFSGIHGGWLSNYYHPKIDSLRYNPKVYGFAFQIGIEVREEILSIEIGLSLDPGKLIFNAKQHPYYSENWSLLPSVGIGLNLYAIRAQLKYKRKSNTKNKASYSPSNQITENTKVAIPSSDSMHQVLIKQQASLILESCTAMIKTPHEKALYKNDTLYLLKPVGIKKFIFAKFYLPSAQKEQFFCITLSNNISNPSIFYISEDISYPHADDLPFFLEDVEIASKAFKGVACLYINPPHCYLNLESIAFQHHQTNVYFDRILLCELNFLKKN